MNEMKGLPELKWQKAVAVISFMVISTKIPTPEEEKETTDGENDDETNKQQKETV